MAEPTVPEQRSSDGELAAGDVIAGRYRLLEPLGEGGYGYVWSATHLTLGSTVAIKFLHRAQGAQQRARFEREARLAAQLGEASRHIARVTDHGITPEGMPWLVMELLRGEGVDRRLIRDKRIPLSAVGRIVGQLCRALVVAHARGVVHRDLKPANVFLCEELDGEISVKLHDFGIAKALLEKDSAETTRAGTVLGTPAYMSPEQIKGEGTIDTRSDLWAVAAMTYRMLVGTPPFGYGSPEELGVRILCVDPSPPASVVPDLPAELDRWMSKGLAKRPQDRFQDARELAETLAIIAGITVDGEGFTVVPALHSESLTGGEPLEPPTSADAAVNHVTIPEVVRARPPRRRPSLAVMGAIAGVLIGGLLLTARTLLRSSSGAAGRSSTSVTSVSSVAVAPSSSEAPPLAPVPRSIEARPPAASAPAVASSIALGVSPPSPPKLAPPPSVPSPIASIAPKSTNSGASVVVDPPKTVPPATGSPSVKKSWDDPSQM